MATSRPFQHWDAGSNKSEEMEDVHAVIYAFIILGTKPNKSKIAKKSFLFAVEQHTKYEYVSVLHSEDNRKEQYLEIMKESQDVKWHTGNFDQLLNIMKAAHTSSGFKYHFSYHEKVLRDLIDPGVDVCLGVYETQCFTPTRYEVHLSLMQPDAARFVTK